VLELGAVHICHSAAFKHDGTPVKLVYYNTTSSGSDLDDNVRLHDFLIGHVLLYAVIVTGWEKKVPNVGSLGK